MFFYHFQHSAKRQEQYKEFLDFTDTEPLKILKHAATRWLSLEKCVKRTLHHWSALQSYFNSHPEQEKPGRVQRCAVAFRREDIKLIFMFLEFILGPLNEFNTTFQADESMLGYLHQDMLRLLRKFLAKFITTKVILQHKNLTCVPYLDEDVQLSDDLLAVGMKARALLAEDDSMDSTPFFRTVRQFYHDITGHMIKKFPFGDEMLKTIGLLNPDLRQNISPNSVLRTAQRFLPDLDQDRLLDQFGTTRQPLTYLTSKRRSPGWTHFGTQMQQKKTSSGQEQYKELCCLSRTLLVLPHSNADTERSFSMLRKIQTDQRWNLSNRTLNSLMSVKMNIRQQCFEFKPPSHLMNNAKTACTAEKARYLDLCEEEKERLL